MRLLFWQLAAICAVISWADCALAQRRPIADDSLGSERSIVTPEENLRGRVGDRITGGARRGDNLFHSFREFGIDPDRAAYFDDPGVQNILSRVTGGNISEIFGVLGVLGDANLFLLNPNGIIFGEGARLDVRGAFVGTTADSFVFEDGFAFSATNPQAPPLLTVSAPIGLQYGIQTPGAITVDQARLFIDSGQSLILAGGKITLNNGGLGVDERALEGGRIDLGAVSESGTVGLAQNGSILSLSFPETLARTDIQIINGVISTVAEDGGSIAISAQNLDILDNSFIQAGISRERGIANSQSGDIVLDATDAITVGQSSLITNNVRAGGIGNGGDIRITADIFSIASGAQLQASTLGQGNAGDIIIDVQNAVSLNDANAYSTVGSSNSNAVGNGGDIRITAGSLTLSNTAQLSTSIFGRGNAGDITINARDTVSFNNAIAFSAVGNLNLRAGVGDGGDIRINTGSLSLSNGSALQASTPGRGNAGNIIINALGTVSFDDTDAFSIVRPGTIGNGGDILITTGSLSLSNGSQLQALTSGRGDAGDVIITAQNGVSFDDADAFSSVESGAVGDGGDIRIIAGSLLLSSDRSSLQSSTSGQGDAGNVIINAQDAVSFNGAGTLSNVEPGAIGNGGDIRITTGSLSLTNGSVLAASILGQGDAGNVIINARGVVSIEAGDIASNVGVIGSDVLAIGNAGNIRINTGSLFLRDGAELQTATLGQGDAGNVIINAQDTVSFNNASAFSTLGDTNFEITAVREGGDIRIRTGSLFLRNGAQLQTATLGRGNAGDVIINARDTVSFVGVGSDGVGSGALSSVGFITPEGINVGIEAVGDGGDIRIRTGSLEVMRGAGLFASTLGRGDAGNVIINAQDTVSFSGVGSNGNPSLANSSVGTLGFDTRAVGNGGDVRIRTGSLEVRNGAQLQAFTLGQGDAGNVTINARDMVSFEGENNGIPSAAFSTVGVSNSPIVAVGNGGDVRIRAGSLEITDGAQLQSATFRQGNAGNVIINARDTISLDGVSSNGFSSGLFALTFTEANERGGDITVRADTVRLADGAVINAQTFNNFQGGDITLNADTFEATGGGQVVTTTLGDGRAGNITLNVSDHITLSGFDPNYADRLRQFGNRVSNQGAESGLFANTAEDSSGRGGRIRIRTGELDVSDRARIVVNSQGSGVAGDIDISAQTVQLDEGRITAETTTVDGGNITLRDLELLQLRNNSLISATAGTGETAEAVGDGGNITIDAGFIVAVPDENSDIRANAVQGSGGNVDITAEGIFGIEAREAETNLSDITASSDLGVQGTVNINEPDVDPSRGLAELPVSVVDASDQIAQSCPTDGDVAEELGEFVVTGRGGLPANPAELLGGETVLTELAEVDGTGDGKAEEQESKPDDRISTTTKPQTELVEAQGWVVGPDGKVMLTAENPAVEPYRSPNAPVLCPSS